MCKVPDMSQGDVTARPGYLVKRVQQLFRQAGDERLRAAGLSMAQYAVLRQLADHPEVSSAELARLCFVTRQSLGEVLAGLRRAGLVTVGEGASGRVRPVRLSDTGRARLADAEAAVADVEDRMLAGLGDGDRRRLAELLARCADNLTPGGGSPAGR